MSDADSIRVILADDHAVVRAGIRKFLESAEDIRDDPPRSVVLELKNDSYKSFSPKQRSWSANDRARHDAGLVFLGSC